MDEAALYGHFTIVDRNRPKQNKPRPTTFVFYQSRQTNSQTNEWDWPIQYQLVQAYHPKFRQPRRPHAIATPMSHTRCLLSCWPPWTVEEGDTANSFDKDLALALAPKMCPDQSQAFKKVNNSQAFTVGRKKKKLSEPLPVVPRHVCTKFSTNIRRTACVGPTSSNI